MGTCGCGYTTDVYSLAYLMEMMIEADELTAAGNPPEFIRHMLAKFRNGKSE